MKKNSIIWMAALLAGFAASGARAQVTLYGNMAAHVDSIIVAMPTTTGGGEYQQPNAESRALWRQIIDHILAGEYSQAHTDALTKNYRVIQFHDTGSSGTPVHIVLERTPESTSRYWGTFVFNPSPQRSKLAILSPHPRHDLNTGYQGIRIYQYAGARAFFVSGTHRCNGTSYSPCDGTTTACATPAEPYRYSDQCHVVDATFQVTAQALLDDYPDLLVVQNHGFSKGSGDPDLVISNGTRITPSGTDYAVAVRNALLSIDPSLTAKVAHINLDWTENIATDNTQGRLINNSPSPCYTPASSANGRFVHVEQAKVGLRDTQTNWMKLARAVAAAFPADASAVPPDAGISKPPLLSVYPNPVSSSARIRFAVDQPGQSRVEVFDVAGRRVASLDDGIRSAGDHSVDWNVDEVPAGIYFINFRLRGALVEVRKCVVFH